MDLEELLKPIIEKITKHVMQQVDERLENLDIDDRIRDYVDSNVSIDVSCA